MPEKQSVLEQTAADQWKVLPSGLTVIVRPMPGYSGTHVIYATRFGSIDRDFRLDDKEVHLPAGVAHFLEHKMFEDQDGDAFAKFAKTGANANAFTAFDRTCYLFTATEQLDESLDVLLEMVASPTSPSRPLIRNRASSGRRSRCTTTARTGGLSPACASACITATPSAATLRARWKALQRSRRRCCTTAARRSMPPTTWCWPPQAAPAWNRSWRPVRATA